MSVTVIKVNGEWILHNTHTHDKWRGRMGGRWFSHNSHNMIYIYVDGECEADCFSRILNSNL